MIALAIARKNLGCLISKPNSFICKSHVSFFLSIHDFTTSTEKHAVTSPTTYDVLVHNHHFSPESATLAASDLTRHCSPERADSVLSLLKENGFSSTQLEKLVVYNPRILGVSVDDIELKLKIFQDLGFSSSEVANFYSRNAAVLHLSAMSSIIPRLTLLKEMLGSDHGVARLLMKSGWYVNADLKKSLVQNVEILKCCGIPMEHIIYLIYKFPRCLLKTDVFRKSIDKVREMGATQTPKMFVLAVGVIASTRASTWEAKLRALGELGFSDGDILEMFKKAPQAFCVSTVKMKEVTELLLATGKFTLSSIVCNPAVFGRSIEKKYKPRLQILERLESMNLIEKWPSLGTISIWSDDMFFESFVKPYSNELGKNISLLGLMSCVKGKR